MDWKKFAGPAILAGVAILIWSAPGVLLSMIYEEGDTVDSGVPLVVCGTSLLSILMCLSSIVWFAFALGTKTQKTVFLSEDPDNFQHVSVPLAGDAQSTVVPSAIGGGAVSYVREKIVIETTEGDTAQMIGFSMIAGSVGMFVLMVLLGFISILMSLGPGLGFSGGTCNSTCETIWSGASFSMWASILLFPCGLIALARPWSWFHSGQDIDDPVVKVRAGIVAGIALIAVISFGWPALLVVGIALIIYAIPWFTQGGGVLVPTQGPTVEVDDFTVNELKEKLREVGLPVSGKKADLVVRLTEYYEKSAWKKSTAECVECRATLRFPSDYSGEIQCPRCKTFHRV